MHSESRKFADRKLVKSLIVIAGIVLGQTVLYGPSLIGQKVLLPLKLLAQPGVYLPQTSETAKMVPHNVKLSDLVYQLEPARRFAVSQIHQGRFPLWAPYQYGGAPFVWPTYSLFLLLECATRSPIILAWAQLFAALVGGIGMFFFCRKSLRVGFWPATVCAWCYPLTAFFVLWQGFYTTLPVYWLPWIFVAVDRTIRRANTLAPIGLSVATFLVLTSGAIDIAGQVLLGSGIFAIWCLWQRYRGEWFGRKCRTAVAVLVLGWGLGFMLATPYMLPLLEYAKTGIRMEERSAGAEERPPIGLAALPQVVLPNMYGSNVNGSAFLMPRDEGNLMESASAAYTGVLTTLLVAPLAWCSRRRRALSWFLGFLAFFGLSWCLDIPGFVNALRLPLLNMMSHNRLVFLTSFAILSLAAIGLENLLNGSVRRRRWFWVPALLLAGLGLWCFYRSEVLPQPVSNQLAFEAFRAKNPDLAPALQSLHPIQGWFIFHFTLMGIFCLLGFGGWLLVWFQKTRSFRLFPVLVLFLVGDLLCFGYGISAQCSPALYYPNIPVLDRVARSAPGRVVGANCLPASLAAMQGLTDIRGYDAVDPAHMVKLLETAAEPGNKLSYAAVQYLAPKGTYQPPDIIHLTPVMDMLNVRYVIFRGAPPPHIHPEFQGKDYWVLVNSNALPRVFIPQSVEAIPNSSNELAKLASPRFNPAAVAYVGSPVNLPAACRGTARIVSEIPTRITIFAHMKTPGLVVLADRWDRGWRAYWKGKPVPILRTNYAIRGVVVPAGSGTLKFVYQPMSLYVGLWLAGLAVIVLFGWRVINLGMENSRPDVAGIKGS